jgi:hypothetical protein
METTLCVRSESRRRRTYADAIAVYPEDHMGRAAGWVARGRAVWLVALVFCTIGTRAAAQTPPSPLANGWVVLTVEEYRKLRDSVSPPVADPPLPVAATLTRADYELNVEGDSIAGRARLTIDVLQDGWTQVQVPAGLVAREARIDGRPLPLIRDKQPHVLLPRAGRSVLELDVAFPLATAAGSESFKLPPSSAPITRATLTLPRAGVDLSADGGVVAERVEDAGESRWTIFGRPGEALTLSWKRRADDRRVEMPLRFRSSVIHIVGLGEDTSPVTVSVRVEVLQGTAGEVGLSMPEGLVVNQVNGASVGDWTATPGALRVRLLEPATTYAAFVVQAEFRAPREGRIVVPLVRTPDAERESGGVAVEVLGAGEVSSRAARGLEPSDPSELGDVVAGRESPSMIAFRLRPLRGADERSLDVTIVRYTPQAVLIANVEEARYRALAAEDGRLMVEARYAVRNNQRGFLKVTLPARSTAWTAAVGGRPMRPGAAETGSLLLPLEKGRAGEEAPTFIVSLVYLQFIDSWPDKGPIRLELPTLDLPVSRTGVQLYYSPRFEVVPRPGALRPEPDSGPFAEAFRRTAVATPSARRGPQPQPAADASAAGLQALVDQYQSEAGVRTVVGSLPLNVTFPAIGPSVHLVSELTAEGSAMSADINVKRTVR